MRKLITSITTLLCVAVLASTALAAVTFDASTGIGFVGKGDVQQPWGWNNAQMNSNAGGVVFFVLAQDEYRAVCTWVTGEGTRGEREHNVSHKRKTSVNAAVSYEQRRNGGNGNLTGFNLTGFGETTVEGSVPEVGGPCPGNQGHGGTWSSVELSSSTGGLFASHPLKWDLALPNTP